MPKITITVTSRNAGIASLLFIHYKQLYLNSLRTI